MDLLSVPSSIPIGTIALGAGMDSNWLLCDGSIYSQSSYSKYIQLAGKNAHPNKWGGYEKLVVGGMASIAKAGNNIVALPFNSADVYYSTDNGDTWQTATNVLPSSGNWNQCISNGTRFVALRSTSNAAAYSDDGVNWTGFTMPVSSTWAWIGWNGTVFGAMPYRAAAQVLYYSSDGTSFSAGATMPGGIAPNTYCYGNGGVFIFMGSDLLLYRTTNGTSYSVSADKIPVSAYWGGEVDASAFIYMNSKWYTTSGEGDEPHIFESSDGLYNNWTKIHSFLTEDSYANTWYAMYGFYTGEEYVLFQDTEELAGHYVTYDLRALSPRFNQYALLLSPIFLSKAQGALVLAKNDSFDDYSLLRLKYTSYDYTTQFQVPNLGTNIPGLYYYIKVK